MKARIDLDALRGRVSIPAYFASYVELRRTSAGYRGPCPSCGGEKGSSRFSVTEDGTLAHCFVCGRSGDIFALVQAIDGVDFMGAIHRVVDFTGRTTNEFKNSGRNAQQGTARRARATPTDNLKNAESNRRFWGSLREHSGPGEAFLDQRGLASMIHVDTLRFNRFDSPSLPIRSYDCGAIINVLQRRIDGEDRKVLFRRGSAKGCLGNPLDLQETFGPVIITEGWADYLTALMVCEDYLVLGAPSATAIPGMVETLAGELRHRGFWLVMHPDPAGHKATWGTISIAVESGISLSQIRVITPKNGDLNDALAEVTR